MTATRPVRADPRLPSVAPALAGRPWIEQAWRDVVFVHWRVDVSAVAPLLPAGVRPDTMAADGTDDGVTTWVGLIAFRFEDTRFPPLGAAGRLGPVGDFVEVNVRVYTVDDAGRHGVVFLSLDAGKLLPTVGARVTTGLPYHWAQADSRTGGGQVGYAMRRHGTRLRSAVTVATGDPVTDPTALETFLTARWGMHARGRFWPNEHEPWPLYRASLEALRDDLVGAAGLPMSLTELPPDSVLYSPGVTTRFGVGGRG